jgi:hypothetical protein
MTKRIARLCCEHPSKLRGTGLTPALGRAMILNMFSVFSGNEKFVV